MNIIDRLGRRIWTDEDKAFLIAHVREMDGEQLAAALGRSKTSIYIQFKKLGVSRCKHWTPAEDAKLRHLWDETDRDTAFYRKLQAAIPGRSGTGIYERAQFLGLTFGIPQGHEALVPCADRLGMKRPMLLRVLHWGGVKVRTLPSHPSKKQKRKGAWQYVDSFDATEALEKWLRAETMHAAAKRYGIGEQGLEIRVRWILMQRSSPDWSEQPIKPSELAACKSRAEWRIPEEIIDQAMRLRSPAAVARGRGVRPSVVHLRLRRLGFQGRLRTCFISPEQEAEMFARWPVRTFKSPVEPAPVAEEAAQ